MLPLMLALIVPLNRKTSGEYWFGSVWAAEVGAFGAGTSGVGFFCEPVVRLLCHPRYTPELGGVGFHPQASRVAVRFFSGFRTSSGSGPSWRCGLDEPLERGGGG
jgi:hypothetical protein